LQLINIIIIIMSRRVARLTGTDEPVATLFSSEEWVPLKSFATFYEITLRHNYDTGCPEENDGASREYLWNMSGKFDKS
jgi:hypothetical protein